jgi:hypothetical protein
VYINQDSLLQYFDIIQTENGSYDISIGESLGLARLLYERVFLYFVVVSLVKICCTWTFCTDKVKLSL